MSTTGVHPTFTALLLYFLFYGCAPVDTYEIVCDNPDEIENLQTAVDWLNDQQSEECKDMFRIVRSNDRDWKYIFPRRGRITIKVDTFRFIGSKDFGYAKHSLRCGARGRIWLKYADVDASLIAHEIGHVVCLQHKEGNTFMDPRPYALHMDNQQLDHLQNKCHVMQGERLEMERE